MVRVIGLISLALAVAATLPGQGKGKDKAKHEAAAPESAIAVRFLPREVPIILDYFGPGSGNLPPGLAKRGGNLPPGLEKQLRRNGQLPPGLQKRLQPFPPELERRLGPVPAGCRRVVMDTRALLIRDATNVVLDILDLTQRR